MMNCWICFVSSSLLDGNVIMFVTFFDKESDNCPCPRLLYAISYLEHVGVQICFRSFVYL